MRADAAYMRADAAYMRTWADPLAYMRADAAYMRTADAAYMRMPLDRPIYALLNYPDGRCASAVALLARLT